MLKSSKRRLARQHPDRLVLICVWACAITLACASSTPQVYWTGSRVGLLPVEVTHTATLYEADFREGFASLYLEPMETSNSPGDIILMAIWLLSIPVGVVGGVVEETRGPSPEELERIRAVVDPILPEFDLARIVRRRIVVEIREWERLVDIIHERPRNPVDLARQQGDRVVQVSSLKEAREEDLEILLDVRIERIIVDSPWEENPMGQIVLETVARLLDPQTGEEKARHALSNSHAGPPLDWSLLEAGEVETFAQRLTEAFDAAGRSLAEEIVEEVWTFRTR